MRSQASDSSSTMFDYSNRYFNVSFGQKVERLLLVYRYENLQIKESAKFPFFEEKVQPFNNDEFMVSFLRDYVELKWRFPEDLSVHEKSLEIHRVWWFSNE